MAKEKTAKTKSEKGNNAMRAMRLEKVVLNCGGSGDKLDKSVKLLTLLTGRKPKEIVTNKRIPTFDVRPGLKIGCTVTLRGKDKEAFLKRLFGAVGNKVKKKSIKPNHFSFGIKEYLEIPDIEYQRDIGILGLDVTAVFKRAGKRVGIKKIKGGKVPKRQDVTPEEIIDYIQNTLKVNVEEPQARKEE